MTVTQEGLRIELTESATGTFFDSGSTKMSVDGSDLVKLLALDAPQDPSNRRISLIVEYEKKPAEFEAPSTRPRMPPRPRLLSHPNNRLPVTEIVFSHSEIHPQNT
jgi:hypothetical protein